MNVSSMRFKVLVALAAMIGVFLALLYFVLKPHIEGTHRENMLAHQGEIAEQAASTIDRVFRAGARKIEVIASLPEIVSMDPRRIDPLLGTLNDTEQFFGYFFVADPEGTLISYPSKPHLVGRKIGNDYWIGETLAAGRVSFLDVHLAVNIGTLVAGYAAPILSPAGDAVGVLRGVITLSVDNFMLEMVRGIGGGRSRQVFVVDTRGRLLAHPEIPLDPIRFEESDFSGRPPVDSAIAGETGTVEYDAGGRTWIAAYAPVPSTGWGVVVQQPLDDLLAVIGNETSLVVTLFLAVFMLTVLILGVLSYLAVRPFGVLLESLKAGCPVPESYFAADETGQLAGEINSIFAERLQAQESLKESEERFRMFANASQDMILLGGKDGRILFANPATERKLGYGHEELRGRPVLDLVSPGDRERAARDIEAHIRGEGGDGIEVGLQAKDGSLLDVEMSGFPIDLGDGVRHLGAVVRDISSRKRMREELERLVRDRTVELSESEERYRDLFESANDMIQIVREDGQLLYVNPAWRRVFGYEAEEIANLKVFDIIAPDCTEHCQATFAGILARGKAESFETVFQSKSGERILIEGSASSRHREGELPVIRCILRDITEKKRLEEEVHRVHKLESLGVLAGGIAHDFNNILTVVLGNVSLAKARLSPGDTPLPALDEAEVAAERARDLTRQLLTFSRGGDPVKRVLSLKDTIEEAARFALLGSSVRCEFRGLEDLWPVEADAGQMSQVVHNLLLNAVQAMPGGGVVVVEGENILVEGAGGPALAPGRSIRVSVIDQGCGIGEETLTRIFDPFYSTKEKGRGLGLASAFSIMKKHGGNIVVESVPGRGSTFRFHLPATEQGEVEPAADIGQLRPGRGRILLMDDEEAVRRVGTEMLEHLGFEVTAVPDGSEAVEAYRAARVAGEWFDAVIMDLTIPGGKGGREAVREIVDLDPGARVVVSSGYANDPIMSSFREHGFRGVIPKPYRIGDLSRILREILS